MSKRKPYNKSTGRDYKSDYEKFQSSPTAIKNRAKRNRARRMAAKKGLVKKGDGKDVDHTYGINRNETRVMSASKNRGRAGQGGRRKGVRHKS